MERTVYATWESKESFKQGSRTSRTNILPQRNGMGIGRAVQTYNLNAMERTVLHSAVEETASEHACPSYEGRGSTPPFRQERANRKLCTRGAGLRHCCGSLLSQSRKPSTPAPTPGEGAHSDRATRKRTEAQESSARSIGVPQIECDRAQSAAATQGT